ncbi:MAG: hypothetical protein GY792_25295 [Gammaproteobacteria bacterium]|nr:hypothetical protein [Gammaproteobacteria bacterium]
MLSANQDIVDLNLLWLLKAQEIARSNRKKAAVMLGLNAGLLDEISQLSLGDLNTIAHAGVLLFQPRFRPGLWRKMIEQAHSPSLVVRMQTLLTAAREVAEQ